MMEISARCALPGCDQPVELRPGGGPQPKYCSREHSIEARRLRQRARAEAGPESAPPEGPAPTVVVAPVSVDQEDAAPGEIQPAVRALPNPRRAGRRKWLVRTGGAVTVLAAITIVGPAGVADKDTPASATGVSTTLPLPLTTMTTPSTSSDAPVEPPLPPPPVPPTGLTADPGNGEVELCWQPVVGATAYVAYYRDVAKAEDWQRMPYPITDRCWTAGQLWNNHTYQYRLIASNSSGDSGFSETVEATPTGPKPGVPGGLTISPGDGQVRLCWKPAPNADMYVTYHRDDTTGERWIRSQYPITNGSCLTAHLLTNGHRYQFRVTSANSNGESGYSEVVQATPATALPAVPTGLTATPGSGKVLLCWQPAGNANAYVAYYRDATAGQDWVTMPYPIQNATCWNADQLWNTHTYEFRLKASNNAGHSDFSAVVRATPR